MSHAGAEQLLASRTHLEPRTWAVADQGAGRPGKELQQVDGGRRPGHSGHACRLARPLLQLQKP